MCLCSSRVRTVSCCEQGLDVVFDFPFARSQDCSSLVLLAEAMSPSRPVLQSLQKRKQGRMRGTCGDNTENIVLKVLKKLNSP